MLSITQLNIYPVKSLGGVSLQQAQVTSRGLQHDRRFMLVDERNVFISQRTVPAMALLQAAIIQDQLHITHKHNNEALQIPLQWDFTERAAVQIFDDVCDAVFVSAEVDQWFSDMLRMRCRLVYMPEDSRREVNKNYAIDDEVVSFADAYPMLVISQESLDDLNSRLPLPLPMNRFRPNVVIAGATPFVEDTLAEFTIGDMKGYGVKLCERCAVPTINQQTGERGREPLKTLATYRAKNNNVFFGQDVIIHGNGVLTVGDVIDVTAYKEPAVFAVKR